MIRCQPGKSTVTLPSGLAGGRAHLFNPQPNTTVSTVRFNLLDGNQPVQIDMVYAKIQQQQWKRDAYGQTASNRLLLSNATMVACLWLEDTLTSRDMKRLVNEFSRKQPRAVTLGRPIVAIHLVRAGLSWPEDEHQGPTSIFNCLPDDQWHPMASKPPVVAGHPLLNQPAETVWFQGSMSTGMPVSVHYCSIAAVKQSDAWLLITVQPEGNSELLEQAIVRLRDAQMAAGLAAGFRLRRVKRVGLNEMVRDIFLYPKAELCRGTQPLVGRECNWSIERGNNVLWYIATTYHPDAIAAAMAQWRVLR